MIELLEEYERPNNFVYPKSIIKLLELNLTNFDVWYFMEESGLLACKKDILKEI